MGQGRLEYSFLNATEETVRVRVFVYVDVYVRNKKGVSRYPHA